MSNSCPTEKELELDKEIESKSKKEKEKERESESKQKKEIYIDNFDATAEFKNIPTSIKDYLGKNYLTDLSDDEFITGLTHYCFNRQADPYEINTLKKRLKTIDRELLQEAYKLASLNGANSLAYITATLNNWEKLGIENLEDWEQHEKEREDLTEDESFPF